MINKNRTVIKAGGGLVQNEQGDVLFMFRRGKWDLPKGKLDPGETIEECAIREVEEETGLRNVYIVRFLIVTEHEYEERGKLLLKESHWFLMKTSGLQTLVPQVEEDISELRWIGNSDYKVIQRNTYPAILDVLKAGGIDTDVKKP